MRTNTQLKIVLIGVLIALATLAIVGFPAQVLRALQSKSPAPLRLPQNAHQSGPVLLAGGPGTDSAGIVSASRLEKRTVDSRATTLGSPLSFLPPLTFDSGATSVSVAVADLNADGKPDLVVGNLDGPTAILLGKGDGTFEPAMSIGANGAFSLAVSDLNGDGKPDIVVANLGRTVGVLLGNGDGSFGPEVPYASGGSI